MSRWRFAAYSWAIAFSLATVGLARGQWEDDFEAYVPGQSLHGFGGWQGWDNNPLLAGIVTGEQAFHGLQSVEVSGPVDMVRPFAGVTTGRWQFRIAQFIPSDYVAGGTPPQLGTYFILLNAYEDGGPYNWSVQFGFNSTDGQIHCDCGGTTTILRPYVTDRWVPIEVVIDLDLDAAEVFYDNRLLGNYPWTGGIFGEGGGALNVAAVDLYANGSSSVFYDYGSLLPVAGTCCPGDLDANQVLDGRDVAGFVACFVDQSADECACADQDDNGVFDGSDIGLFVSKLLAGPMCFEDVRHGIPDAPVDPPQVQFFYDMINRTNYLIGDIPAQVLLTSTPSALLPQVLDRLNRLAASGLVPVDVAATTEAMTDAAELAGPMTVLEVLSMPPDSNPELAARLEDLRNLGINIPRLPETADEAANFLLGHNIVLDGASDLTYTRYYFSIRPLFGATEREAIDNGRDLGIFAEKEAQEKNNKCCLIGICDNKAKKFCKFRQVSPYSTLTECVEGSDRCP